MTLQDWIDSKYKEISKKLPLLVNTQPDTFVCGHASGYKEALLDLDQFLEEHDLSNKEVLG